MVSGLSNRIVTRRFDLAWGLGSPLIMGIVNVTPDSFSDGGQHDSIDAALAHARLLLDQGADILDVGGESTRPGAQVVDSVQEWARVQPILHELVKWQVPVSIDTMKPEIMSKALVLGVDILNDVNGFRAEGAGQLLAESGAAGVVMHMHGEPRTMQVAPHYLDVVADVSDFLEKRVEHLMRLGVGPESLLVDPGFGFGKTLAHNHALFRSIRQFSNIGAGVLVGVSRKKMIGEITGKEKTADRVIGSAAAALLAAQAGAAVVRVHDVAETVDSLKVLQWSQAVSLSA